MKTHHVLPQKFIEQVAKAGLDINDPMFGACE